MENTEEAQTALENRLKELRNIYVEHDKKVRYHQRYLDKFKELRAAASSEATSIHAALKVLRGETNE